MELNDYLLTTLIRSDNQVTFSGDRPNLINKFLVKGAIRDESNSNSLGPAVNNGICFTIPNSAEGVSTEKLESNWRYYRINSPDQKPNEIFTTNTDQYIYSLCSIYCSAEKDAVINIWNMNPIRIWINGRLVMTTGISYNTRFVMFAFKFQKGLNTILFERMRYTANHIKLGIVDLVSNVSYMPIDFLSSSEYIDFFDVGLLEELKHSYIIMPEKSLFKDRKIKFVVLPKWFDTQTKERVQIEIKDSKGKLLKSFEAFTGEHIQPDIDEDINGVLTLKALGLDNFKRSFDTHIFYGNFVKERNLLIQKAEQILGTENSILKSFKRLVKLPDLCNETGEMLQEEIYERMLNNYSEFENALLNDINIKNKSTFDIFDNNAMIYYESEIDDGCIAYGVNLPENFSKEKTYPLILLFQIGYAFSAIYRTTRYVRRREFDEAVIVTMCARSDISFDYINEIDILNIINAIIQDFKIDRDQIYSVGHCSGAIRAIGLAVRKPDLFSGIGNIAGLPLIEHSECFNNIENLSLYNLVGFDDLLNIALYATIQQSEQYKKIKNYFYNFYDHPELNEFFNSRGLMKALLKDKKEKYPKRLYFTAKAPIYNKSYWIYIDIIESLENRAEIKAEILNEHKIIISTHNIKRFSLLLGQKEMNLNRNLEILLNNISYKLEITDYVNISFDVRATGIDLKLEHPDYMEFQRLYNSIAVKEELLGLKQVYLKKCIILKPDNLIAYEEDYKEVLFDILQNPLKSRIRNYKYEIFNESIIDEKKLSETNFVMYINPLNKSNFNERVLNYSKIELDQTKIIYDNKQFGGNYFAVIKVKNPFDANKLALLVTCNSKSTEEEMMSFLKTFDSNSLFFSDTVIYNNGKYHSFRAGL
jgi:hypothetical protein